MFIILLLDEASANVLQLGAEQIAFSLVEVGYFELKVLVN